MKSCRTSRVSPTALSIGFVALAVVLLMAPAAYHRLVYAGEDNEEMHHTGSLLVTLATVPLAIRLAGDLYVVIPKIAESDLVGIAAALAAMLLLFGLWYGVPLMMLAMRQRTSHCPNGKE